MRECDRTRALLAPALYDELGEEEARRLRAHLDACPTCAAELAESRDLLARLSPDLLRPSPEARARLLEELRVKTAVGLERPRWRPTWQQALVGAVCLALVVWLALRVPTSRERQRGRRCGSVPAGDALRPRPAAAARPGGGFSGGADGYVRLALDALRGSRWLRSIGCRHGLGEAGGVTPLPDGSDALRGERPLPRPHLPGAGAGGGSHRRRDGSDGRRGQGAVAVHHRRPGQASACSRRLA